MKYDIFFVQRGIMDIIKRFIRWICLSESSSWAEEIIDFPLSDEITYSIPRSWYPIQIRELSEVNKGAENRYYEELTSQWISKVFPDQGTFINVGASCGYHLLNILRNKPVKEAHLFEINPLVIPILEWNCKKHVDQVKTKIYPYGISDEEDLIKFYLPHRAFGGVGIGTKRGGSRPTWVLKRPLPDIYANKYNSLILIDVEGHELSVINGSSEFIINNRPIIVMELNEQVSEEDAIKIYDLLFTIYNYKLYKPTDKGLKTIESKKDWMDWRGLAGELDCRDVILIPAEFPSISSLISENIQSVKAV